MIATVRDDPAVVRLVERARVGDSGAWDQLVQRYAPLVWSVCRHYGLAGADADDVAAGVWLRLVERLDTIREPAALPGWLKTTAQRECLHLLRAKNRQVPVADDEVFEDDGGPACDEWLLAQERQAALRAAFAGLSERCRRLLAMLFADPPVAYARIGAELEMAIGAIGPTRQRCLQRLRGSPELAYLHGAPAATRDGR
jgi:RNA polymerase sigma factor (sigma-70 family)